ncbi:MAG: acetyltransferase [Thermoanaerobaculia bacterium]
MLRGVVTSLLLVVNTFQWGTPILLLGVVKLAIQTITPRSSLRNRIVLKLAWLGEGWVRGNDRIFDAMLPTQWDIEGIDDEVRRDARYLIISNHRSWVDILALQRAFRGRAPFLRFFIKEKLIFFPIVGQACWALEFPFMKRYSREYLEAHPEKRGADLITTRKACARYRHFPVSVLNFVEGSRFDPHKKAGQQSPFRHLLRPRPGGIGFVLASLGDQLDATFDVTIAYPQIDISMWKLVSGNVPRVVVRVRRLMVPPAFLDAAITEPGVERDRFKEWVQTVWEEKDLLLDQLLTSPKQQMDQARNP